MEKYRANGKLLISGEYAVLDGAIALAVPTRFGQTLEVKYIDNKEASQKLKWEAFLHDEKLWFSAVFDLKTLSLVESSDEKLALRLLDIFKAIQQIKPNFFADQKQDIHCKTQLEFPKDWGLGSSSTLIDLLAQFAEIDAFDLNQLTFNTSGYDVACARIDSPILYQIKNGKPHIQKVDFRPDFIQHLYFVYLNQKQDTQVSVSKTYKNLPKDQAWIEKISELTLQILSVKTLDEFENLIESHEDLIASKLGFSKVKDLYFSEHDGKVKSLGAWGGDFVLMTSFSNPSQYLNSKNYTTYFSFEDMVIE